MTVAAVTAVIAIVAAGGREYDEERGAKERKTTSHHPRREVSRRWVHHEPNHADAIGSAIRAQSALRFVQATVGSRRNYASLRTVRVLTSQRSRNVTRS